MSYKSKLHYYIHIDAWPVVLKHEYTNCNLFARQNLRSIRTLLIIIAQKNDKKMLSMKYIQHFDRNCPYLFINSNEFRLYLIRQ